MRKLLPKLLPMFMIALAAPAHKAPSQPLLQAKPHDAYGGQKRHTDPDPNVQFEMMRQRNWRKGG
jgi:hypothetical protein